MSKDMTPEDPEMPLAPLDDELGPAHALLAVQADRLASDVVRVWTHRVIGLEPVDAKAGPAMLLTAAQSARVARAVTLRHTLTRWPFRAAAAVAICCCFGGVAFAAVKVFEAFRGAQGVAAPTASQHPSAGHSEHAAHTDGPQAASLSAAQTTVAAQPVASLPATVARPAVRQPIMEDAATLLRRANAARASRDFRLAETLYLRVLSRDARTHERYVASVAAGALALEHGGEPRRALGLFEAALGIAPDGDLSEEARYGVAHAYRALADREAESRALRTFLERHPQSLRASAARARLRSL